MAGTISMMNNVTRGVKFNRLLSVMPAYANEPKMPAPPVPDDQADMVVL